MNTLLKGRYYFVTIGNTKSIQIYCGDGGFGHCFRTRATDGGGLFIRDVSRINPVLINVYINI